VADVKGNRVDADVKFDGSGFVIVPFDQQFQKAGFMRGQFITSNAIESLGVVEDLHQAIPDFEPVFDEGHVNG
jgi:hypothetical protein